MKIQPLTSGGLIHSIWAAKGRIIILTKYRAYSIGFSMDKCWIQLLEVYNILPSENAWKINDNFFQTITLHSHLAHHVLQFLIVSTADVVLSWAQVTFFVQTYFDQKWIKINFHQKIDKKFILAITKNKIIKKKLILVSIL